MKKVMRLTTITASIVATSLLLASSASFAAKNYKGERVYKDAVPCPEMPKLLSGLYLGGQIGYDMYRVRNNVSIGAAGGTLTANPAINPTGFVGGLFLGYGQYFSDYYYLGGEILGNYSGASTSYSATSTLGTYNSKFNAYGTWGLALLPGLKLNDTTLLYLRLGYNWTRMKSQESTAAVSVNTSNTQGGFAYGLGMESLITGNWSLRTEYSHTNYNSFSSSLGNGSSFSPSNNQVMLGLLYHFV